MNFNTAEFTAAYGTFAQLPASDIPEIAFAGKSNVGKSSLLNRLFGRKSLARVSSVPGKTVTVNFYTVEDTHMVDLPGYGYAKVPKAEKLRWAELMEGYFGSDRDIRLVIQLLDMRHPPTKDDMTMLNFLTEAGYPFIAVLTKSDKLNKTEYKNRMERVREELKGIPAEAIIPFSAANGEGTTEIKAAIEAHLGEDSE